MFLSASAESKHCLGGARPFAETSSQSYGKLDLTGPELSTTMKTVNPKHQENVAANFLST